MNNFVFFPDNKILGVYLSQHTNNQSNTLEEMFTLIFPIVNDQKLGR